MADNFDISSKGLKANEIAFDYLKGPDFRTVWVDGGFGGATPSGHVHVALYAERPAIPRRQVFSLETGKDGAGVLGHEVLEKRISRAAVVREMACDLRMTADTAEALANWLMEQAAQLKREEAK